MAVSKAVNLRPRKCIIKRWGHFNGFGFHLNELKDKDGHFVGNVESNSPAESAHLLRGDRIIEINGSNVTSVSHVEAVARVKRNSGMVTMLVVDTATDRYYREMGLKIYGGMDGIQVYESLDSSDAHRMVMVEEKNYKPRKCLLRKWPHFNGYGFHLHKESGRPGEYVGAVIPDSPAHSAHLKEEDKIIEVNGLNVFGLTHSQTIKRMKENATMMTLLVVDPETDLYYRRRGRHIHGGMDEIEYFETMDISAMDFDDEDDPDEGDKLTPRLCQLYTWDDFPGYGFNLHVLSDKSMHLIGNIEEGSPAEAGGLLQNDVIIEVNGQNVEAEDHADLVKLITTDPRQVRLLVLTRLGVEHYKENGIPIHESMSHVHPISCPTHNPSSEKSQKADPELICGSDLELFHMRTEVVKEIEAVNGKQQPRAVPRPRLCFLRKWQEFQGYGFNVHVIRGEAFHLIGAIDTCSPAEAGGLEEGDIIIEVNGWNVENETHQRLVGLIKENSPEVKMLVVPLDAYEYYKQRNIRIHGDMPEVRVIDSPAYEPPEEI